MLNKERIDRVLVKKGFYTSRQQAQQAIRAGFVFVGDACIRKPSWKVCIFDNIQIKGQVHPYVSRGGVKLEEAIRFFSLNLKEKIVLDIGSSTGGFTDCALQHGANLVYAIDVGHDQLDFSLREDIRVIVMEGINFRYLEPKHVTSALPNFATIDVSFISLKHILPPLLPLLLPQGEVVALIKPQFEAGRRNIGKNGVIKDPNIHYQVLSSFIDLAYENQFDVNGITVSPIQGSEGNIEFIGYLTKSKSQKKEWGQILRYVIEKAHLR